MFRILNLTTLSLFLGLLLIVYMLFDGNWIKKILAVVASIVLLAGAENLIWIVSRRWETFADNESVQGVCAALLALVIILLIERIFKINNSVCLSGSSYLNMTLISVGSGVIAEIIVISDYADDSKVMLGLSIICLMNVSVYYLYGKVTEAYEEKSQKEMMEQQMKMYVNQFELINQSQRKVKSIHHDLKNHMLLLRSYLLEEKYEEALFYIDKIESGLVISNEYAKSGNLAIDSIINYMLERVGNFCSPHIELEVPDDSFILDYDLNIILGNLLDNAIEAIKKAKEKRLFVKLRFDKGIFYIGVYNSYDGILKKRRGKFPETKKNRANHGIGMANIQTVVDKYNGIMEISNTNNIFKVDIALYVGVT